MGTFVEEITLTNSMDRIAAKRGYIKKSQIRSLKVMALPDTGAWTLTINKDIQQKLGLEIEGEKRFNLADGTKHNYPLTEPVRIKWKNCSGEIQAVVVDGAKKVLLGALPLEAMNLIVDPVHQTLAEATGDQDMRTI